MFVGSGRVICWGRRSWSNVCSGPIFGVDTVCTTPNNTLPSLKNLIHVVQCLKSQRYRLPAFKRTVLMQIYMWLGQWLLLPLLYYSTPLGASIRSAMGFHAGSTVVSTAWTLDHIHALALLFTLATFATLYRSLYASDPGFLGSESDAKHLQMDPELAFACPYCGSRPTTRSKHSKVSGQCVHKFDHSCWLLSTDIGDRNHGIFWVYLVLQESPP